MLGPLLALLGSCPDLETIRDLDCVEFFSGVQSITGGFTFLGMRAFGVDKCDFEERSNLLSFMLLLMLLPEQPQPHQKFQAFF